LAKYGTSNCEREPIFVSESFHAQINIILFPIVTPTLQILPTQEQFYYFFSHPNAPFRGSILVRDNSMS